MGLLPIALAVCGCAPSPRETASGTARDAPPAPTASAEIVLDGKFKRAEGIAFNGEGRLFVAADDAVWSLDLTAEATPVAYFDTPVGLTAIGERDLLVTDAGETRGTARSRNDDGRVLRLTPEGEVTVLAEGLGDPEAVLPLPDGTLLVSDAVANLIHRVRPGGAVELFTDRVDFPSAMVLAEGGGALYVAQTYSRIDPIQDDDRLWRVALDRGEPTGEVSLLFATRGFGGNRGLVVADDGALYLAANRGATIWRVDPASGTGVAVARKLWRLGGIAFGAGAHDPRSLYVTQEVGGKVWRVEVGAGAAAG